MIKYILPATIALTLLNNTIYNSKAILLLIIIIIVSLFALILRKEIVNLKITSLVLTFLGLSWLSYIFSSTANLGVYEVTLDSAVWILFIYLVHNTYKTEKNYLYLVYSLILFGLLQSTLGIFQFLTREESRIAGSFLSWHNHREYFPNALGLFFLLTTPFIYLIKKNWLFASVFTLNTTALLLSFSRGALIIFLLQTLIIVFYLIYQKQQKKLLAVFLGFIIAFSSFSLLNNYKQNIFPETTQINIAEKYTFSGTERITSLNERQQFFHGSLTLMQKKPLLGFGPNSFSYVYPQIQPLFLANAPHPHNWILKIGLERGILTLIPFLLIFIYLIYSLGTIQNRKILLQPINFLTILSVSGALLHNLIDFNLNFVSNYLILIILIAHLFKLAKDNQKKKKNITYLNLLLFGLICLISISWTFKELT